MKIISKKVDNLEESTIVLSYIEWDEQLEEITNFIQSLGEKVPVYGKNGEMLLLQVENILYFEAVGELVFAYTDDQVYEIKKRLYQLEQSLESHKIIRASKSMLLNLRQIRSVRPAVNGRFYAKMSNGEEVLISRQYAKGVTSQVMSA